jgi:arylsulfatase A-like enzyme
MPKGKPNILILWGDDIGQSNLSCYSDGLMGYETPNIDRISKEGVRFIHYYAEQSCTAGRAAFITGQSVFRTGLSKVGLPGAEQGFQAEDSTIPELLKPLGYRTGQFGKNHFGDRDEHLPTMHGFDEFFGNLYHLNAEEEPELPDYPPEDFPNFAPELGPRGVSTAGPTVTAPSASKTPAPDQKAHGNLSTMSSCGKPSASSTMPRMPMSPSSSGLTPPTCTSAPTAKPESKGQAGRWQSEYHDTMIDHDKSIGEDAESDRSAGHRRQTPSLCTAPTTVPT